VIIDRSGIFIASPGESAFWLRPAKSLAVTVNHAQNPQNRTKTGTRRVHLLISPVLWPLASRSESGTALEFKEGEAMSGTAAVVHSDPDILGGTPVFQGTRVPFRNLIDYLERGYSLEEFLDAFPSVTREQVVASLEAAHEALSVRARSAR
jgi:uncharacterized protein (DUF433 family)